jgi:hypothetical protein
MAAVDIKVGMVVIDCAASDPEGNEFCVVRETPAGA